jgi:hypothetical protein
MKYHFFVITTLLLGGCVKRVDTTTPFHERWNAWAEVANARAQRMGHHGVDARERDLWEQLKAQWPEFARAMDAMYNGR